MNQPKEKMPHASKSWRNSFAKGTKSVLSASPIILSVLLLFGLFRVFVPTSLITRVFSGNPVKDTIIGGLLGSVFAGNAVNSYIIGGELLRSGVSLFAVTAFLITWVTIGIIQFPVESAFLGKSFALKRNVISFIMAFLVSVATVFTLRMLG